MNVRLASLACLCALIAACGQRGPLYLPEEAPVEVRQTSGQPPAAEPTEPATEEAAEPSTTQPPPVQEETPPTSEPEDEPTPKPDESDEETPGTDAGKPR